VFNGIKYSKFLTAVVDESVLLSLSIILKPQQA
jgi:hypothetical protein